MNIINDRIFGFKTNQDNVVLKNNYQKLNNFNY